MFELHGVKIFVQFVSFRSYYKNCLSKDDCKAKAMKIIEIISCFLAAIIGISLARKLKHQQQFTLT